MRSGAAGAGKVDKCQAMLRTTRLLQQAADGGEFLQHGAQFRIVAEAHSKTPLEAFEQDAETFDAAGDACGDLRYLEIADGIVECAPLQLRSSHMLALPVKIAAGVGQQQQPGNLAQQSCCAIEGWLQGKLALEDVRAGRGQGAHDQCPAGAC